METKNNNQDVVQLVQRAKKNEEQAQAELVRITYQKAYFVAYNIVRNEETAKDILQEAYITAFQKIYQLKDDEKFVAWFSRIVNNKTIDYLRSKEGKNQEVAFSTLDNGEDDLLFEESVRDEKIEWNPGENMNYQVLREGLEEVLNTLPDKQRMALLMYYFEEKSVAEIAETMGVGQSAIKSALAYGRKKIKDCIEAMRAKGTSFYGFAPLSIFMNVMDFESTKVNLEGVSSIVKAVAETGSVAGGAVATAEASKHGASGLAKWWASKSAGVKVGACVATTAVAGGGIYIANATETVIFQQEVPGIYTYSNTLDNGTRCFNTTPEQTYIFTYSKTNKKIKSVEIQEKANIYEWESAYRAIGAPNANLTIQSSDYTAEAVQNRDATYDRNFLNYQETIDDNGNWIRVKTYDVEKYLKEAGNEPFFLDSLNMHALYQEPSNSFIYDEEIILSQIEDLGKINTAENIQEQEAVACYSGMHKDYKKVEKK